MAHAFSRNDKLLGWGAFSLSVFVLVLVALAIVRTELSNYLIKTPDLAIRIDPSNEKALVKSAEYRMAGVGGDRIDIATSKRVAKTALSISPLQPQAWRVLAAGAGAPDQSLLNFARSLSRRDMPTLLLLIEDRVVAGDLPGVLSLYDIILRVDPSFDTLLFPTLNSALSDPLVVQAAAPVLREASWSRRFYSYLVGTGNSFDRQAEVFSTLASTGAEPPRDIIALQAQRAAEAKYFLPAGLLYKLAMPAEMAKKIRDPNFTGTEGLSPFSWVLHRDDPLHIFTRDQPGVSRLEITSERGDGGLAAHQLLYLKPGQYKLTADVGKLEGYSAGGLQIDIACTHGKLLDRRDLADNVDKVLMPVSIPQGCPSQFLSIRLRQELTGGRNGAWISSVKVIGMNAEGRT